MFSTDLRVKKKCKLTVLQKLFKMFVPSLVKKGRRLIGGECNLQESKARGILKTKCEDQIIIKSVEIRRYRKKLKDRREREKTQIRRNTGNRRGESSIRNVSDL